jgi:hypothetical protein
MSKTNYQVTIGYKAVITVNINADSEQEARKQALEYFKEKERKKWYNSKNVQLEDDSYADQGVLNMDETWLQI